MPDSDHSRRPGRRLIVVVCAAVVLGLICGVAVLRLDRYRRALRLVRADGAVVGLTTEGVPAWLGQGCVLLWGNIPEEFQAVERLELSHRSSGERRNVRYFLMLSDVSLMRRLAVPNSDIDDGTVGRLRHSRRLESLDLTDTAVSGKALHALSGLPSLRHLKLTGTRVDDSSIAALKRCGWLETLDLSRTACGDAGLRSVLGSELENVSLSSTNVTDMGLQTLAGLRTLHSVDVNGSEVTDAGFAQFRTQRPDVDVYYRGALHHRTDAANFVELIELFNQESVYTEAKPPGGAGP